MTIKIASNELERNRTARELLVYEHSIGPRRFVIPVVTEHTRSGIEIDPDGDYEFFSARASVSNMERFNFHDWHNQVSVTLCHKTKRMKIGPTGQLIMYQRGIGLGPALMACVIGWLKKQNVEHYTISRGFLSRVDAETDQDREQRNRFYMAFGFTLSNWNGSINGLDVVDGHFTASNVGALSVPERYQNRLKPWFMFESALQLERQNGVYNLCELRAIERWANSLPWFMRWFLRKLHWPVQFLTRHKHEPWEPR